MSRPGLPILTYHALDDSRDVTATEPRRFAATMARLHAEGFRAVDLDRWVARGRPPLERAFALSFDDGLRSIRRAADVLARYRFPATAFLVTGKMGRVGDWPGATGEPLLRWSDLDDLDAAGFRFASHTRHHPRLDRPGPAAIDAELLGARDDLEQRTGRPCRLLAYPYGIAPAHVREAAARHYRAAFGTRLAEASARDDPFRIARIDAFYLRSARVFDLMIEGDWGPWLRMRRALRRVRRPMA